jgi:hypothetical protein
MSADNVQFRITFNFMSHPLSRFEQGAEDTTKRSRALPNHAANL